MRTALPSLFGLAVLVVDPDPVALRATRATALRLGLAVGSAHDGHAAIAALRTHPVDAVLIDLHMPGLDGLATTRAIRALGHRWARVPVLGIGACAAAVVAGADARHSGPGAAAAERERCRAGGLDALLAKPVEPTRLAAALHSLCRTPGADPLHARGWSDAGPPAPCPPLPRLEQALEEQLATRGAEHPLTRALMRAAGRRAIESDLFPVSLTER